MENVEFAPDGSFAYRPGELLVPAASLQRSRDEIEAFLRSIREEPAEPSRKSGEEQPVEFSYDSIQEKSIEPPTERSEEQESDAGAEHGLEGWVWLEGVPRLLAVVDRLRRRGIAAQPNHVLFATCECGCGCGPHPADPRANPFYANPFYANPFYANPFYANPFYANPFYANPFYANPFYANPNPGRLLALDAERRESSARPAKPPSERSLPDSAGALRVTVVDTGFRDAQNDIADASDPRHLVVNSASHRSDVPDAPEGENGAKDGYLDPAAGHGTFIAGIIQQVTAACDITVLQVLSTHGVGDEATIAAAIDGLPIDDEHRPHFLNLSFGGYSPIGMGALADAIEKITAAGTVVVASAGNDGTCVPMYPAAFPGVIAVGAVDAEDNPAAFSNFGPWVRACSLGVDVESAFFTFDGKEPLDEDVDIDKFDGWATWSGTSFAAPRVVAALAQWLAGKAGGPYDAVEALIDAPDAMRIPKMGTLVAPSGNHWHSVKMAIRRRDAGG